MAATAVTPKEPAGLAGEPASNVCVVDTANSRFCKRAPGGRWRYQFGHGRASTSAHLPRVRRFWRSLYIAEATAYRLSGITAVCTTMPSAGAGFNAVSAAPCRTHWTSRNCAVSNTYSGAQSPEWRAMQREPSVSPTLSTAW